MLTNFYKLCKRLLNRSARKYYSKQLGSVGKNFNCFYDIDIVGGKYIAIGDDFIATQSVRLHAWKIDDLRTPVIKVGSDVTMTDHCYISCVNKIVIGNGVLFGSNCFITDNFHGNSSRVERDTIVTDRIIESKGPVIIEDNVWIGRNSCIMPNVTVGRGAIIGANSVVTHDIPPYTTAVGAPAHILQEKNDRKEGYSG